MPYDRLRLGRSVILVLTTLLGLGAEVPARADLVVLYTASTDTSGGTNPQSVPSPNLFSDLPAIDPGVTINPDPAFLDGGTVGPINVGITYGPLRIRAATPVVRPGS